jgi:hypothetical protein
LTNVSFGSPLGLDPESTSCVEGSDSRCLWVRRYERGLSAVNVSPTELPDQRIPLGVDDCRYVKDVYSDAPLANGECVTEVRIDLPAWSGRPLVYSTEPW